MPDFSSASEPGVNAQMAPSRTPLGREDVPALIDPNEEDENEEAE